LAAVSAAAAAGGVVAWSASASRPTTNVERFSRAAVGCTTTLEFQVAGTYYVFEERGRSASSVPPGCEPAADAGAEFETTLDGGVAVRDDRSVSYVIGGSDEVVGTSIGRFEIDGPGRYELAVTGPDDRVVAAVGRDPRRGVESLRVLALAMFGIAVVIGAVAVASSRGSTPTDRGVPGGSVPPGPWPPPSGPPLG
jgi:hypothetical protein